MWCSGIYGLVWCDVMWCDQSCRNIVQYFVVQFLTMHQPIYCSLSTSSKALMTCDRVTLCDVLQHYLNSHHLNSTQLTSTHLTSHHLNSPQLNSPHLNSPQLSPHLTSTHLNSPQLSPHLTSTQLNSPQSTSCHLPHLFPPILDVVPIKCAVLMVPV